MFQDIAPYQYRNEYITQAPVDADYVLIAKNNRFLLDCTADQPALPQYGAVKEAFPAITNGLLFLFTIDEVAFYLSLQDAQGITECKGYAYCDIQAFREMQPGWLAFGGATAAHLAHWYHLNRYCGSCGTPMTHSKTERAMCCDACGVVEYPKISPCVIVTITDGDRILMTKYANNGYKKYALIAGFMEIGETFEDTIRREVMEEVGVRVKNIRYYKSQPWAFSDSVLAGFFAELDGDDHVTLDHHELSEAVWFSRKDIPVDDSTLSLTWDMIEAFRNETF